MERRDVFTTEDARGRGITISELRWGERHGRWRRIEKGVYVDGPAPPGRVDAAIGAVRVLHGAASGALAGTLHELDSIQLDGGPYVTVRPGRATGRRDARERMLATERLTVVSSLLCTDGLQTMVDLAATVDDLTWEQAFESARRKRLLTIKDLEAVLPELSRARTPGVGRIRRVLALCPPDAPPTGSLLETLFIQLARKVPRLGVPVRQFEVRDCFDQFVAFVDVAWPELGLFVELDGQQHLGQPVYDASRETAVVAATGWLCGRFTWTEVKRTPTPTARRLAAIAEQARLRPVVQESGLPLSNFILRSGL